MFILCFVLQEALIGEVKSKRGINECLPSMDLSFYNSDVTVEVLELSAVSKLQFFCALISW